MGGRAGSSGRLDRRGNINTREGRLNRSGEYQYHATTPRNLIGIYNGGLTPNRGELGRGVYFSETEQQARDWAEYETTGGGSLLRVKTSYLRDKTDYDLYDNTQGMTSNRIPVKQIEILNKSGEWESLQKYAQRYSRSFGLRR